MVKFLDEDSPVYNLALQIWLVLIGMAHNRQTTIYDALAWTLGYASTGVQFMSRLLDQLMRYCQENNLPPLTVLVINRETGNPVAGLSTLGDVAKDRERVFNHDWFRIFSPTPEEFGESHQKMLE